MNPRIKCVVKYEGKTYAMPYGALPPMGAPQITLGLVGDIRKGLECRARILDHLPESKHTLPNFFSTPAEFDIFLEWLGAAVYCCVKGVPDPRRQWIHAKGGAENADFIFGTYVRAMLTTGEEIIPPPYWYENSTIRESIGDLLVRGCGLGRATILGSPRAKYVNEWPRLKRQFCVEMSNTKIEVANELYSEVASVTRNLYDLEEELLRHGKR